MGPVEPGRSLCWFASRRWTEAGAERHMKTGPKPKCQCQHEWCKVCRARLSRLRYNQRQAGASIPLMKRGTIPMARFSDSV